MEFLLSADRRRAGEEPRRRNFMVVMMVLWMLTERVSLECSAVDRA
jgi:hypothetical protein